MTSLCKCLEGQVPQRERGVIKEKVLPRVTEDKKTVKSHNYAHPEGTCYREKET